MFFQLVAQVARKEKSEFSQSRVKPMTFWLLFNQILYHWATDQMMNDEFYL